MYTLRNLIVVIAVYISAIVPLHAGLTGYSGKAQGPSGITSSTLLRVEDDMYRYMTLAPTNATWNTEFDNYRVNNYVRLKFDESARLHSASSWTVTVVCDLDKWDEAGVAMSTETFTLTLTYDPAAGTQYTDYAQYVATDPGHRTEVDVVSVTGTVPADVMLESIVEVERYYYFDYAAVPDVAHTYNALNNTLTFNWEYLPGAEEYDFEWTFVSAYDDVQTANYDRARRVTLSAQNYTINLPFDDGKIYYRVRGAGKYGTDWNLRSDGAWGTCVSAYTVANLDASRNWSYNAVYAEDGKRKEAISFFDGSLRQRQAVTISNSDNVAMQTETFYDYEGRVVIQTLPAPDASFGSELQFYTVQSANTNTTYQYNRRDYDHDALYASNCTMTQPVAMSENNGASRYYSSSNNHASLGYNAAIPDANQFPFTQVTYDREGRVKKQTGAGEDFHMGSGHETEYFYANPSQERLDRLFGVEAGDADHYSLRAAEDANGQLSLAYVDMHGRVVATSLAGAAPSSMDAVEGNSLQSYTQDFGTLNYYDPVDEAWVISNNFLVTNPNTNYDFTYTLDPQQYESMCNDTIDGECEYELIITIFNACDVPINATGVTTLPLHTVHTLIGPANLMHTFTVQFPKVGTYRIEKRLKLSQAAMDAALEEFIGALPGSCISTEASLQSSLYGQYSFDCNDCETWCEQQATAAELTGEPWTEYVADCMAEHCSNVITTDEMNCSVLLEVLKDDMSPEGQYYEASGWMYDNLENTPSPYGTGFSWSGFDSYVTTNCGYDPDLSDWNEVDATWDDCYAGYLVQFHPEYCQYQWCTDLDSSNVYDIMMFGDGTNQAANTLTWAENTTIPWYNPTTDPYIDQTPPSGSVGQYILDHDPFFKPWSPGNPYLSGTDEMQEELDDYQNSTMSMWDYAETLVTTTPCTTGCDEQWQVFRALYIGTKQRFVKMAREADGCYPLYDNNSPPDGVADGTVCNYTTILPPDCNPPGVNGYEIRWPDYVDNLDPINTTSEADTYADAMSDAYQPCKEAAYVELEATSAFYNFDLITETVGISVNAGAGNVPIMAAPLSMMGNIDGATLIVQLVQAINSFVSVPDYTAAIHPSDPLKFRIYAAASLGATPNGVYYPVITKPGGLSLSIRNTGFFDDGSDDGECPQNKHCLCAKIDQIVAMWNATYVDPTTSTTYNYISHTTYPDDEDYVYYVLHGIDATVTTGMVDNWMLNCTASDGQDPVTDIVVETPTDIESDEPLTAGIDCENPAIDCDEDANDLTDFWGSYLYQQQFNQAVADFITQYKAQCWNNGAMIDNLSVTYQEREYHYTLYYYDQAGNLTRTVPPAAVEPLVLSATYLTGPNTIAQEIADYRNGVSGADFVVPEHSPVNTFGGTEHLLVTYYTYNSLNQVEESTSPDGGTTRYFYDQIGRIIASQNAKQAAISGGGVFYYSYIRYDALGRVIESGQVQKSTSLTHGTPMAYASYETWLASSSSKDQVTEMYYDTPLDGVGGSIDILFDGGQQFLRKRVATVTYERDYDSDELTYDHATHYSYDVHGNVDSLIQETPDLNDLGQRYKYIGYTYDLVSGNVNDVHYQSAEMDQMHHHYTYDADNRLTNVYTSTYSVENSKATPTTLQGVAPYDQDAKYFYYLHGPLARTEMGDNKIQGLDYAYTINGWIKGVNANTLVETNDLGKDGTAINNSAYISTRTGLHSNVGRDAFGYVLGYYWNNTSGVKDWEPIHSSAQSLYADSYTLTATSDDLFNGNIKEMSTALMKPNVSANPSAMPVIFNRYHYDQLNRIRSANSFTHASNTTTYASHTNIGEYSNTFTYDPNGNILTQFRNGNGANATVQSMDDLGYHYYANTNRLEYVDDGGTAGNFGDDLEDQSAANYTYTPLGELLSDESEGIEHIQWNINGKIHKIERETGWSIPGTSPAEYPSDLEFKYDAMGNRVCKIEKPRDISGILDEKDWIYTYYVRDASGNVMAVYTRDKNETGTNYTDAMSIAETHIYGGSRLGIREYRGQSSITASVTYLFNGYESIDPDHLGEFEDGAYVTSTAMPHPSATAYSRKRGQKAYELSNHLGNVLVTFYDRKVSVDGNTDGATDYYLADVGSASDYSAFGAPLPGRCFSNASYRYGFNGKEDDRESVGTGHGLQDYGFRIYNPSLGRFLSRDPLAPFYPELTPYQFASNTPIQAIDLDGLEKQFAQGFTRMIPKPVTAPPAKPAPKPQQVVKPVVTPKGDQMAAINADQAQKANMAANPAQPQYKPAYQGEIKQGGIYGTPEYQMQATNLDNVATYTVPFYDISKKAIKGEHITVTEFAIESAFAILPFLRLEKPIGVALGKVIENGVLATSRLVGYKTIGFCMEFADDFMRQMAPGLVENGARVTHMRIDMTGGKGGVMSVIDNGVEKRICDNGIHEYVEVANEAGETMIYDNVFSDGISKEKYLEYLGGDAGKGYLSGEQIIQQYATPK